MVGVIEQFKQNILVVKDYKTGEFKYIAEKINPKEIISSRLLEKTVIIKELSKKPINIKVIVYSDGSSKILYKAQGIKSWKELPKEFFHFNDKTNFYVIDADIKFQIDKNKKGFDDKIDKLGIEIHDRKIFMRATINNSEQIYKDLYEKYNLEKITNSVTGEVISEVAEVDINSDHYIDLIAIRYNKSDKSIHVNFSNSVTSKRGIHDWKISLSDTNFPCLGAVSSRAEMQQYVDYSAILINPSIQNNGFDYMNPKQSVHIIKQSDADYNSIGVRIASNFSEGKSYNIPTWHALGMKQAFEHLDITVKKRGAPLSVLELSTHGVQKEEMVRIIDLLVERGIIAKGSKLIFDSCENAKSPEQKQALQECASKYGLHLYASPVIEFGGDNITKTYYAQVEKSNGIIPKVTPWQPDANTPTRKEAVFGGMFEIDLPIIPKNVYNIGTKQMPIYIDMLYFAPDGSEGVHVEDPHFHKPSGFKTE